MCHVHNYRNFLLSETKTTRAAESSARVAATDAGSLAYLIRTVKLTLADAPGASVPLSCQPT
jgi:hypothetical protein